MNHVMKDLPLTAAALHHPFTCSVVGPTQSGKSTFVRNLLMNHEQYVDRKFDYIYVLLGTSLEDNPVLREVKVQYPRETKFFKVLSQDDFEEDGKKKNKQYARYVSNFIVRRLPGKEKNGCIVFDDLMSEMGDSNIITDFFTKKSSHENISIIHITQNLFHKGRSESQNATLYKNTHLLVIFNSPLDSSTVSIVARRMSTGEGDAKRLKKMMLEVIGKYRYIAIRGSNDTPEHLRFTSDYFAISPFLHFKAFTSV